MGLFTYVERLEFQLVCILHLHKPLSGFEILSSIICKNIENSPKIVNCIFKHDATCSNIKIEICIGFKDVVQVS